MTFRLKQAIVKCISESVTPGSVIHDVDKSSLRLLCNPNGKLMFNLFLDQNVKYDVKFDEISSNKKKIVEAGASRLINFTDIRNDGRQVKFEIDAKQFIKDVLSTDPTQLSVAPKGKKVIVEFSSPNIAKHFHVGHFRSTITGNFVSNIKKKFHNDVIKMNYLGDWGTQYGLLIVGINRLGYTEESLHNNTMVKLSEAYVHANKSAPKDSSIGEEARNIFQRLESGDEALMKQWQQLKEWTVLELESMYKRLNVQFDEYEWESDYSIKHSASVLESLNSRGIVTEDRLGRKVATIDGNNVPLLKSDGTTLYLLRDVAAFFSRKSRHNIDKIYYVVETGQAGHFNNLSSVCNMVEENSSSMIEHVKFGRIVNMSTRKGSNILLHDVLNEARERTYQKQIEAQTTKCQPNIETADILGASCIMINDMRHRRRAEYSFDWETALHATGKSGVQLQYAHCRLSNLLVNSGATLPDEIRPELLLEPDALNLILEIARYEDVLVRSERELEAVHIVKYLFDLMQCINKAFSVLPVKGSDADVASQRLSLFNSARLVLADAFKTLGITPLEKM